MHTFTENAPKTPTTIYSSTKNKKIYIQNIVKIARNGRRVSVIYYLSSKFYCLSSCGRSGPETTKFTSLRFCSLLQFLSTKTEPSKRKKWRNNFFVTWFGVFVAFFAFFLVCPAHHDMIMSS